MVALSRRRVAEAHLDLDLDRNHKWKLEELCKVRSSHLAVAFVVLVGRRVE